jgi:hypothetical protein
MECIYCICTMSLFSQIQRHTDTHRHTHTHTLSHPAHLATHADACMPAHCVLARCPTLQSRLAIVRVCWPQLRRTRGGFRCRCRRCHLCVCVCVCVCVHIKTHVRMYLYMYMCSYVSSNVCVCVHNTHRHIYLTFTRCLCIRDFFPSGYGAQRHAIRQAFCEDHDISCYVVVVVQAESPSSSPKTRLHLVCVSMDVVNVCHCIVCICVYPLTSHIHTHTFTYTHTPPTSSAINRMPCASHIVRRPRMKDSGACMYPPSPSTGSMIKAGWE